MVATPRGAINVITQRPKGDFGERDDDAFNIALRWEASENFSVDYNYDNTDSTTVPRPPS